MKGKSGSILIAAGLLCLAAALGLTAYNLWDEQRAARTVETEVAFLAETIPQKQEEEQPLVPEVQVMMTSVEVDGRSYVGILELPTQELTLSVQSQWNESLLKRSPCLYEGTIYDGMIIAGHNYRAHFARLNRLRPGDPVTFTDVDGNRWNYTVTLTEVIHGNDAEGMKAGDWDLTLFTCTYGGEERFTVRCTMEIG